MKKTLGIVIGVIFPSVLLSGCFGQIQPGETIKTIENPTVTYDLIETPVAVGTAFSTVPPLPTFDLVTPGPLPKDVFDNFEALAGYCRVKTSFGIVKAGETIEEQVISDMAIGQIRFSLFWSEGDLDLVLIQPDGTMLDTAAITSDEKNRSFTSRPGLEEYFLRAPEVGTWTAKIIGKSAAPKESNYMLEISALDATTIAIHFDKNEYFSGDPVKIAANLHDTDMYWDYNRDVVIKVITEDPGKKQHAFELYDDGAHGDEKVGDGIFANVFNNTLVAGLYKYYFKISGHNQRVYYENGNPQHPMHAPFERECFLTTEVK